MNHEEICDLAFFSVYFFLKGAFMLNSVLSAKK